MEINEDYTIEDLVNYLELPEDEKKIILVNDYKVNGEYKLRDGDQVVIYSLMVGG